MTVRLLPEQVIDQIAAGEVVERPAAVVKELAENALDAGATRIEVHLRGGGVHRIRVVDDGSGMDRQDALLSIERHATSKLRALDDLMTLGTLGFRGEALPSIASVSRFTLTTRRREDEVGTRIRIEDGKLLDVSDAGGPPGTEIDVRSLFGAVPARRKFLRSAPTELGHCTEAVTRLALARYDVGFRLVVEDRDAFSVAPGEEIDRLRALLGDERWIPIDGARGGVSVGGWIAPPEVHRSAGGLYL
ncbi:MAG: ATP-binding protein, partial [Deltaproteobacteria bacterium]|nr:ATP-binding protein [Deltaproteobacteria bacterium]